VDVAEEISVRAYARRRGVSHVAVLKAIKSGRIARQANGKLDPEKADRQWAEHTTLHAPYMRVVADVPQNLEEGEAWLESVEIPELSEAEMERLLGPL
jgi:hypothetical protein